jgi:hypothetical protein
MGRGLGLAIGKRFEFAIPAFTAFAGVAGVKAPPTAIPTPTKAGMTVVDRRVFLNVLTSDLLFPKNNRFCCNDADDFARTR